MPNKIKIFFGFLVLIALFSVFSLFGSLGKKTLPFLTSNLGDSLSFQTEDDVDHDGLTNQEESYWNTDFQNPDTDGDGFLDGEEVISGHDPLKPGPDDILLYGPLSQGENKNITNSLADLIVSGIYAGDLRKTASDTTFANAVDSLSLAALYDGIQALSPEEIKSEEIKTVANLKTVQEQYVNNIINIIEKNLLINMTTEPFEASRLLSNFDVNNNANNENIAIYFLSKSEDIRQVIQQVEALEVPSDWIDLHKAILFFLKSLQLNYDSLASIEEDPLKALIAINQLQNTYLGAQPILASFAAKLKTTNLNISNNEFLNLINNLNGL